MYSIDKAITYEYTIQKSKFITKLYYIDNKDINLILNDIKKEYPNANHYCYAYILGSETKMSDDGEPSGTAGVPILNVLKKNNLNNILCIVIRYFGGIKLGSGGLIRAYTNSVVKSLQNNIIKYIDAYKIRFTFSYENSNQINFLLKDCLITYKEFNDDITYEVIIEKDYYNNIKKQLSNSEILESCYIKEHNLLEK